MNYTVADFIIRLKNASLARRREVRMPFTRMSKQLAGVLVKEGYLQGMAEEEADGKKTLVATIRFEKGKPLFSNAEIISKPSLRVYQGAKERGKRRMGITVLSTSSGVMTLREATKKGVGGEVLFALW